MTHLQTLMTSSKEGQLFLDEQHSPEELLKHAEGINMYCFYGRCLGFQVCLEYLSVCERSSVSETSHQFKVNTVWWSVGVFSMFTQELSKLMR
jgi:Hormone-sensitive lipase (HSL) N-terminus.